MSNKEALNKVKYKRLMGTIWYLFRESDRTHYGFLCDVCGASWKIYQNPYHSDVCIKERRLMNIEY